MAQSGRGFRVLVVVLLVAVIFELLAIVRALTGGGSEKGNIGVVEVLGTIEDSLPAVEQIQKYVQNDDVKAIVLRIDSPGGAVGSSQEIHDAVLEAMKKKKVVASLGNVAASGGYYVAAPANKIVADPGTITGSIGVIAHFFVLEDLLKKAYLRWEVIKAGEVKDMGSPFRMLTPKERGILQSMTDDIHLQFIEAVAAGRKLPIEKVKAFADGRVVSGRQAKEIGLVDQLGGLEAAIKLAGSLAKIEGEPEPIYPEREHFGWMRKLAEGKFESPSMKIEYRFLP